MSLDQAPPYAERIPRWQQLDPVGRAVADYWCERFGMDPAGLPEQLVVAMPQASNEADVAFAASGAFSPQKFVATLPSVAAAPVLQMTGAVLPVLCVQKGEDTVASARAEADLLLQGGASRVGILIVLPGPAVAYEEVRA
jgi:hypothetical protein